MTSFTAIRRPGTKTTTRPADIILAETQADGRKYADRHGHRKTAVIITPRSIPNLRGRTGPVYATRKIRSHSRYRDMLDLAISCGLTLPRMARDRRVA